MTSRWKAAPLFVAAALATTALPAAAHAAPGRGTVEAVTEASLESGRLQTVSTRPGAVSRGVIGIRNKGTAPIDGLVVEIHLNDEHLAFARQYDNCWYQLGDGPDSAWCAFDEAFLTPKAVRQLQGPVFAVKADTAPGTTLTMTRFSWGSKDWADANGGIEAMAGAGAVKGTQGTLALEPGSPRLRSSPAVTEAGITTAVLTGGGTATGLPANPPVDPNTAQLAAVTEKGPETYQTKVGKLGPDTDFPGTVAVRNDGGKTVDGLVLELRLSDNDLSFTTRSSNCWYALEDKPDSAWCAFDDTLAADAVKKLATPIATTGATGREEIFKDVRFHWTTKAWADEHGGIQALTQLAATPGTSAVRGTGPALELATVAPGTALAGHLAGSTDFLLAVWAPGAGPSPSPTPAATPTTTKPATGGGTGDGSTGDGSSDGQAGGDGGGLPVTGTKTALVAGIGLALLLAGGAGLLVARRRKTRFLA
ncbi:LPXTG cell wall anchor domain-containing protein [Actinoplanes sp. N902-109]|uniref:LPXTG cell wall anchor domain-containing protein n=1 Tax=Actinoplanes sp. (strain N902-109) TaxID=649831 RepID=UPI00032961B1|nr:LPXTG cell wall anchor domain-containing protein [Actinoplanes sp. N902-109]AGL17268.1 hypothetical protein L083_3758 [Actinoplanes sp. N902-109]